MNFMKKVTLFVLMFMGSGSLILAIEKDINAQVVFKAQDTGEAQITRPMKIKIFKKDMPYAETELSPRGTVFVTLHAETELSPKGTVFVTLPEGQYIIEVFNLAGKKLSGLPYPLGLDLGSQGLRYEIIVETGERKGIFNSREVRLRLNRVIEAEGEVSIQI